MRKRLMTTVVFSGERGPDPAAAAAALREEGHEVAPCPRSFAHGWSTRETISSR